MDIEQNSEILAKYLSGECSNNEKSDVENWVNSSDENKELLASLEKIWNGNAPGKLYQNPEIAWQKFSKKAEIYPEVSLSMFQNMSKLIFHNYTRYAAVLLLFLIPLLYFSEIFNPVNEETNLTLITVAKADRQNITLPDGTLVTLDAGSQIKFPRQFSAAKREVYLNGEGYFEVTHDPDRVFIVHANQGIIEVLGTKFNIRSWKLDKKVSLAVTEGKVSFRNETLEDSVVVLTAGKFSQLKENQAPAKPINTDLERNLSWMNNEIYFENVSLAEVISQLERWYDITIRLEDEKALNDRLTINIKNQDYQANIKLLATVTGFNVKHQGKLIMLY